jgi:hypothetical protein
MSLKNWKRKSPSGELRLNDTDNKSATQKLNGATMPNMPEKVKQKIAGHTACLIISIIVMLGWPWSRRLSLLVDRLDSIREGEHE